jgi:hypothetical protein
MIDLIVWHDATMMRPQILDRKEIEILNASLEYILVHQYSCISVSGDRRLIKLSNHLKPAKTWKLRYLAT